MQEKKEMLLLPISEAVNQTIDTLQVERAVRAYLAYRDQMIFDGGNADDSPLLNKRIAAVYEALAAVGIELEKVTVHGIDDTLSSFVSGYIKAQEDSLYQDKVA